MSKMSPVYVMPETDVKEQFDRVFAVTGCRTQVELAAVLNIGQASVADAKRRGNIPSDWLLKLLRLQGVNPDWIILGNGTKFLTPRSDSEDPYTLFEAFPPVRAHDALTVAKILRCFPVRDLVAELHRRKNPSGKPGDE